MTLTVSRRVRPGKGWTEIEIQGRLRQEVDYLNDNRHRCFGAEGPSEISRTKNEAARAVQDAMDVIVQPDWLDLHLRKMVANNLKSGS